MLKRLLLIAALICLATAPAWAQSAQSYNCSSYNPNPAGQFCINTGSGSTWVYPGGDLSYTYGILCSPTHSDKCGAYTVKGLEGQAFNGTLSNGQTWCFNAADGFLEPCAPGGVNHVVSGSSVSLSCSAGSPWDSFEQNPLTAPVSLILPNGCPNTYSTVAYLATQGSGGYTISITSPTTLIIDAPGSGGFQAQIGPTAGNTLWLVFHWDNGNQAWHETGMAPFPPISSGQSLFVYSGSGASAIPVASTLAHTYACVSDAAACTNGVTYVAGGGSTNCHVHSDGYNWIEDGFGC